MELKLISLTLCISLSVMLTPSASQQVHGQSSHNQGQDFPVSVVTLPRKLRLLEEVKVNGGVKEDLSSYNKLRGSFSGKQHRKESGSVHARGSGTMQEWMEEIDPSHYFSMDYSHVKRRRPIHNKSLPVDP
ncbi:hypothetical protein Vadar_000373 [Vaccinium darrowii]|uniref:Uncharacterized protein n=1 Tax=Vaccinium darrowii TaxID=229202 RepID=A0ACB7XEI7_9ERIC|nr:hypothetical protein Vadar_000373 [Vaccinium darrowii]